MVAAVAGRQRKRQSCARIARDDNWRHEFGAAGVNIAGRNFGVGKVAGDAYLIQRLQISAAIHLNANWQIFAEIEDDKE
jgi:hypothetical protein